jgi:hypothetical protein
MKLDPMIYYDTDFLIHFLVVQDKENIKFAKAIKSLLRIGFIFKTSIALQGDRICITQVVTKTLYVQQKDFERIRHLPGEYPSVLTVTIQ